MISTGSMSDPYSSAEEETHYTHKTLEIINKYEFGVTLHTKSNKVLNDLDVLKKINNHSKAVVQMTLTTFDEMLCQKIEPNVCTTKDRFEALKVLYENGIPTIVWLCPILPFINDTEENLLGLLDYCIKAHVKGILCFGFSLTLREGNREYFYSKLDEFFPGLKEKYIKIYGNSYNIVSKNHSRLLKIFQEICRKEKIMYEPDEIFQYLHEYPIKQEQLSLFD